VTEAALAEELASRMTAKGTEPPLVLDVAIRRDADAFEAMIRVGGRKQGVRSLRAAGPACDALHDALVVTLLLLLDEDPSRPPAPQASEPARPPEPPPAGEAPPAGPMVPAAPPPASSAQASRARERPTLWVSLGVAATHGLPLGWSVAATGDVFARVSRWELGLGAFWAPAKSFERDPGTVEVSVFGGRLRGCYTLATWSSARWAGCAVGVVGALHGQSKSFTTTGSKTRPWISGGLGTDVELLLSPRFRLGIVGAAAASAQTESFSIRDELGEVYRTDRVIGWVAAEIRWHIW
jgi:hypothetical protein